MSSITSEAKQEVERLLRQDQKIAAITYLCDTFGISVQESKILVDVVEKELQAQQIVTGMTSGQSTALSGDLKARVVSLLQTRKKLEAVKQVKMALNTGLKEALMMVEEVDKETNPNYRAISLNTGCFGNVFRLIAIFFGAIGLLLVAVAGLIYYFQLQTIDNSESVTGKVVELKYDSKGASAPIILYDWHGSKKTYNSNTWSTPSAYDVDEEVPMFINKDEPDDVVVDTFSDRWLLIAVFGGLGLFFVLFAGIFLFVSRKF